MKTLYIECNMGAAGDMLLASLAELTGDVKACEEKLNSLGIPGVTYSFEQSVKCGITGTHARVIALGVEEDEHLHEHHEHSHEGHVHSHEDHHHEPSREELENDFGHSHDHHHEEHDHGHEHHHEHDHDHDHGHHHHHTHMSDIENIINGLDVSEKVKKDALTVYGLIADAESRAHGKPVSDIHFHEVGTMDAVADIVGVCVLIEMLAPDTVAASPLATGYGQVRCAHGILPVPAPATAHIIEGIPTYSGDVEGELLTPTGAALLKHFASSFGPRPVMTIEKTGYGMGKKDFPKANMIRTFTGFSEGEGGKVTELRFNVDDMTGEEIGYATGLFMENGALDVFTTPVFMKKNRPGILFTVLVKPEEKEKFAKLVFENTTTIGIRYVEMDRYRLDRHEEKVMTKYGEVRVKVSEGFGVTKAKPEYDDLAGITGDLT